MFYPQSSVVIAILLFVFFWASVTRLYPNWFDWPVAKLLNDSTLGKRNETLSQLVRLASSKAAQRFHKKTPPREQACVWRRIPDPGGDDFGILGLVLLVRRDEVGSASRAIRQRWRCRLCGWPRTFLALCNASNTQANFQSESATPSARCLR